MSKYDEMVQAATEGRENWIRRRDSTTRFIYQLLLRFQQACQIPEEHLQIVPWDNSIMRFRGVAQPLTSVLTSAHYDQEEDRWQAGVVVYFEPTNYFPRLSATFALFVTENDYKFTVQIGEPGKPQSIDLNVQPQVEKFFDALTEALKDGVKQPEKGYRGVKYGFAAPASQETTI